MEITREINGIKYRMATLEDHPKLIDFFFDIYLKDEPATKSRGGSDVIRLTENPDFGYYFVFAISSSNVCNK